MSSAALYLHRRRSFINMSAALNRMLWLFASSVLCVGAASVILEQARLQDEVLNTLILFTQGQKDSIHSTIGISPQHEQYSGLELMYSLRQLGRQGTIVEIDGALIDLEGMGSDDVSIQDSVAARVSASLVMKASYRVHAQYNADGSMRIISFFIQ